MEKNCFQANANETLSYNDMLFYVRNGSPARWHVNIQFALGVCSVMSNPFVIGSVYAVDKSRRTSHMHLKCSLAVADLLSGLLLVFAGIADYTSPCQPPSLSMTYDYIMSFQMPLLTTSFYHLTYMAVCRFNAVGRPFNQPSISNRKTVYILLLVWALSLGTGLVYPVYTSVDPTSNDSNYVTVFFITFLISWAIPYLATVMSTVLMLVSYKYHSYAVRGSIPGIMLQQRRNDERCLIRTIFIIVLGYSFTCGPCMGYILKLLIDHFRGALLLCRPEICRYSLVRNLHSTIQHSNPIVDVLVYSLRDRKFKRYMRRHIRDTKELFCCYFGEDDVLRKHSSQNDSLDGY